MSRAISSAMQAAVAAGTVAPALFCFLDLVSGPVRVWTGVGDYVLDGHTFTGIGTLGGVEPIKETKKVSANGISLTLSGIPEAVVSMVLSERYRGRPVTLWLALFSPTDGSLIASPTILFGGLCDTMALSDSGDTSTLTITCESRLIDLQRTRIRRYTDEDQKAAFPGDRGLEFVAGLQNKEVLWGTQASTGLVVEAPVEPGDAYYNN